MQIDNKTELYNFISFENGGTHSRELSHISKSIWSYLLSKQIAMSAEYLPSVLMYMQTGNYETSKTIRNGK